PRDSETRWTRSSAGNSTGRANPFPMRRGGCRTAGAGEAPMDTFYDRRADRLFVTEAAHPVAAWAILACAAVFVALCVAMPFMEKERGWLLLLEAMCIAFVAFLLFYCMRTFTEVVATFDGKGRSLTVTRTQPWRRTEQIFRFEDIVSVDTVEYASLDGLDYPIGFRWSYRLEITLGDDRPIPLRATDQTESDDVPQPGRRGEKLQTGS